MLWSLVHSLCEAVGSPATPYRCIPYIRTDDVWLCYEGSWRELWSVQLALPYQNLMVVTVGRIIWRGLLFDEIETEVGLCCWIRFFTTWASKIHAWLLTLIFDCGTPALEQIGFQLLLLLETAICLSYFKFWHCLTTFDPCPVLKALWWLLCRHGYIIHHMPYGSRVPLGPWIQSQSSNRQVPILQDPGLSYEAWGETDEVFPWFPMVSLCCSFVRYCIIVRWHDAKLYYIILYILYVYLHIYIYIIIH